MQLFIQTAGLNVASYCFTKEVYCEFDLIMESGKHLEVTAAPTQETKGDDKADHAHEKKVEDE